MKNKIISLRAVRKVKKKHKTTEPNTEIVLFSSFHKCECVLSSYFVCMLLAMCVNVRQNYVTMATT